MLINRKGLHPLSVDPGTTHNCSDQQNAENIFRLLCPDIKNA